MKVVGLEGFVQRAPHYERAVEIGIVGAESAMVILESGIVVVAHVIYIGAGLEPVFWSTDSITFEDLELRVWL